ncbi:PLD nuclease N-terminal domain-containing protein [Marivita sp.]|uniref:PLD nuclease N-terminal domain-containing protein n=1 Tax=Marivita sp. TaxID=2003365 RepID=UPI0025BBBB3E|nr:PLD nuclease N-terminal domain-containing protein [Marivita sp.]
MEYGIFGILVLIADIYALVKTWESGASTGAKLLWTVVILLLPVLGVILWLLLGPKAG